MNSAIYRLQGDRDIHIWDDSSGVPVIVAGCIVQPSLTFRVLYSWLGAVLVIPMSSSAGSAPEAWYLVRARLPVSPMHPVEVDPQLQPIPHTNSLVPKGHFVIRIFRRQAQGPPTYLRVPSVRLAQFLARKRAPSRPNSSTTSLGSPSDSQTQRSQVFRNNVRQRDGQCRITGTHPGTIPTLSGGTLGLNYTGLQAAHIFPLAYAHRTEPTFPGELPHYDQFRLLWDDGVITSPQDAHAIADSAPNGILLRSDIHLFFDDYQFAFLVPLDPDTPIPSHPMAV
ncbi:hypothetical protein BS47DRAFT_905467 [Hydnum rufescens UP504]|uniref:HNH nuclease domain-containing protein n=1 Tax=Hydnum rufescens UP504 TaxID=1448309 RepID=A0A9P6B038_9AGAM|nr:hypothetical protein BS47DRAFT_905467 [Hydnum rufescens UP504]